VAEMGGGGTHIYAALEDDGFMPGPFTVGKCAYCLSGLVRISNEEVVKSFQAKLFQEVLAVERELVNHVYILPRAPHTYMDPEALSMH
jgi:hypothetical protein